MQPWMWVLVGIAVLALLAYGGYVFYWKRMGENHFHLFRCRLIRGKYATLAENARGETVNGLSDRLTFLTVILDAVEAKRYSASSVADLHYDDVQAIRRIVRGAERDLTRAEFLERKFRSTLATVDSGAESEDEDEDETPPSTSLTSATSR